ncbi:DUF4097 family beta strand repeat-containing protein [Marinoscillum furvescens]|uniref:Putative adhesin n=1 Tax=Marinoscillum furvescens DSM 4134 TaxID=1122208 RepID=A0A3D9KXX3_MARFU|nr:DUF4097 family beta strand repeat-containing protein [Marinoscillum furvescens]RED94082.1 putative adhesin [Marinoscillum furvescens DSM 4134]
MKRILTILTVLAVSYTATAQLKTFKQKIAGNTEETTLVIENLFADLVIEGSSTGELLIETDDYEGIPEKAKGLRPLSATGPENTGVGLSVTTSGGEISVSAASGSANDGTYIFKVPKNLKVRADLKSWQGGDIVIRNMANEVEVKSMNGDLRFEDVTGPLVANSISSDIEVVFTNLSQSSPTSLSSTSGDIDVTLPATTRGNFKMGSISGEIYTDLDFDFENDKDLQRVGGDMSANATLNGGGVEVSLKCISGNVYIRKK